MTKRCSKNTPLYAGLIAFGVTQTYLIVTNPQTPPAWMFLYLGMPFALLAAGGTYVVAKLSCG